MRTVLAYLFVTTAFATLFVSAAAPAFAMPDPLRAALPSVMAAAGAQTMEVADWGQQRVSLDDPQAYGFGSSVAVDGDTAVVGSPYGNKAYVYTFQNGIWTEVQELAPSDGQSNIRFGSAVAMDGDTIVVGAPFAKNAIAYVYRRSGGVWAPSATLVPGSNVVAFGNSVAIDGSRVLIGAPNADSNQGAAYVFLYNGLQWSQAAKLVADDGAANDQFGFSVSLSGERALIGAYMQTEDTLARAGAAYVFDHDDAGWQQSAKLVAADAAAYQQFGNAVSLDGSRAAIAAARSVIDGKNFQGAVYLYENTGGNWAQTAKIVAADGAASNNFGMAVALKDDTLAVGADRASFDGMAGIGAAYLFTFADAAWALDTKLGPNDAVEGVSGGFGDAVAVDATRLAVGAHGMPNANGSSGATYLFVPQDDIAYLATPIVAGGLGSISPDTAQIVPYGDSIDFVLAPAVGYHVASVDGTCGGTLSGLTFSIESIANNCTVEVSFAIDPPTTATVVSGAPQSVMVNSAFPLPIVVAITNDAGLGVPDVEVTFNAPETGASAHVAASGVTDVDGRVSLPLTANSVAGVYAVVASAAGVEVPAQFQMTNLADAAYQLKLIQGDGQSAHIGAAFPAPLTVQLLDGWNNPITGANVSFSAPGNGASATLMSTETTSNAAGIATVAVTANQITGSYTVTASASGLPPVDFALTNTPADIGLNVAIGNGRDDAPYGSTQNYLITISNSGSQAATGVDVAAVLAPQLDAAAAHWICLYAASGACAASGDGALADSDVTIPARGSAGYMLSAPVRSDAEGSDVAVKVMANSDTAPAGDDATDTDVLVVFRDGFERPEGWNPLQAGAARQTSTLDIDRPLSLSAPAPQHDGPWIETVFAAADSAFRIERLNTLPARVRLVAVTAEGMEHTTAWLPMSPSAPLVLDVAQTKAGTRLRLTTASGTVAIPLPRHTGPWLVESIATGDTHE